MRHHPHLLHANPGAWALFATLCCFAPLPFLATGFGTAPPLILFIQAIILMANGQALLPLALMVATAVGIGIAYVIAVFLGRLVEKFYHPSFGEGVLIFFLLAVIVMIAFFLPVYLGINLSGDCHALRFEELAMNLGHSAGVNNVYAPGISC